MAEWTDQLSSFTDAQIERGLRQLDGEFPPSLPAFKKLCLTDDSWIAHKVFPKALPRPKADKKIVIAEIKKMRRKLESAGLDRTRSHNADV